MPHSISARTCALAGCAVLVVASAGYAAPATQGEAQTVQWVERYCQASWRNAGIAQQDWEDCTQQTYVELLHRVARGRWLEAVQNAESRERRELNRSIWCITQRWRRRPRTLPADGDVADEAAGQRSERAQAVAELREVIESPAASLSRRQREILHLALAGADVAEIAAELGEPPQRISSQKYKALAKLRASLA